MAAGDREIIAEPGAPAGWRAQAFAALLVLCGILAVYAERSLAVAVPVLAILASGAPRAVAARLGRALGTPFGVSVLAALAWSAASTAWAPAPAAALAELAPRLALAALGVWLAAACAEQRGGERRAARSALRIAVVALLVALLAEELSGGFLSHRLRPGLPPGIGFTNHGGAVLAVLVWPAAGLLGRRLGRGALLLGVLAALAAVPMDAAPLAAVLGGLAGLAAARLGRPFIIALIAALMALAAAAPWAARALGARPELAAIAAALPQSWAHRLLIWEYTAAGVVERPLLGHGFRSAHRRADRPAERARYLALAARYRNPALGREPPLHPHSAPYQLWYELGAIGVGLVATVLALGLAGIARRLPADPAAPWEVAAVVAFLTIASLSFGAWQGWWLAAGLLAAGGCRIARCAVASG